MTLAQLKVRADALKIGGRVLPSNDKLEAFQTMVFDNIIQLCDPLNLAIPYQDSDIYRPINEDGDVEWFLKKPRIAEGDADYIDIDSRLETAFVYYLIALVANDEDKVVFERRADRMCVEYAVSVLKMGLPKAKEVYEEESFVTSVHFDCVGRVYQVDASFVDLVMSCLLCGQTCMVASQRKQLDLYKSYLEGEPSRPADLSALRALDRAVFLYLLDHIELVDVHGTEKLNTITTLSCEFEKISNNEPVETWVDETATRLNLELEG